MAGNCLSWANHPNYRKICAAYDMFFAKFANHKCAQMRISTLTCRFRECAALLSFGYVANTLGISVTELVQWIFVKDVASDVKKVYKDGEELNKPDSYTPYLMDLGISMKSPYSSASNQSLHTFLHVIGATLSVSRSCNAKHLSGGSITGPVMNEILMAYAFSKVAIMDRMFSSSKDESVQLAEYGRELVVDTGVYGGGRLNIQEDLKPGSWVTWFQNCGYQFPDKVAVKSFFKLY